MKYTRITRNRRKKVWRKRLKYSWSRKAHRRLKIEQKMCVTP